MKGGRMTDIQLKEAFDRLFWTVQNSRYLTQTQKTCVSNRLEEAVRIAENEGGSYR